MYSLRSHAWYSMDCWLQKQLETDRQLKRKLLKIAKKKKKKGIIWVDKMSDINCHKEMR